MKIIKDSSLEEVIQKWMEQEIASPDFLNAYKDIDDKKTEFYKIRKYILETIPDGTKWYYVAFDLADYDKLLVINSEGWNHCPSRRLKECSEFRYEHESANFKKLNEVLDRVRHLNEGQRDIICRTKDLTKGPYTIIEGNHRAIAYAKNLKDSELNLLKGGYIGVLPENSDNKYL